MIGTIVGAGVSAIGGIAGGLISRSAARKQRREIDKQEKANQAWYDRRYNEDYTQRADSQAMLTKTKNYIADRYNIARSTAAVTGASDASVAAQQQVNNNAMVQTAAEIASQASVHKDNIDAQKNQMDANISAQRTQMALQQNKSGADLASNALEAGGKITSAAFGGEGYGSGTSAVEKDKGNGGSSNEKKAL